MRLKNIVKYTAFLTATALGGFLFFQSEAENTEAAIRKLPISHNEAKTIDINLDDFVVLEPRADGGYANYSFIYSSESNGSTVYQFGNGKFWAAEPGTATVIVTGRDRAGEGTFFSTYSINIKPERSTEPRDAVISIEEAPLALDMSVVTLSKNSIFLRKGREDHDKPAIQELSVQSGVPLDTDTNAKISWSNTNPNLQYAITLKNSVLGITTIGTGKDKLTVTINGKSFTIDTDIALTGVSMSQQSLLLAEGESYQLSLKGADPSVPVVWKSLNEDVAVVSQDGTVTAFSSGNAVIIAETYNSRFGCIASVTTPIKKKIAMEIKDYASKNKYSQPKRMLNGFYDCSSLVWRFYDKNGYTILRPKNVKINAPTAADMGKFYTDQGMIEADGISKTNVNSLQFEAGDLLFQEGKYNGRYRNIYHIEMIYGLKFEGFDIFGNPVVKTIYANNHQSYVKGFIARPEI